MKKNHSIFIAVATFLLLFSSSASASDSQFINARDVAGLSQGLAKEEKAIAEHPSDKDVYRRAGIAAHQLAMLAGKGYSDKAVKYLSVYLDKVPDDVVVQAYLGSSYAMLARDSGAVIKRLSNVNKGIDILNNAVKKAPDNFVVRMVRGSVFYELPTMFNYTKEAFEDFSYVVSRFGSEPMADNELQAEVYYKLGKLASKKGDSSAKSLYFAKTIETAPESHWAGLAKKE